MVNKKITINLDEEIYKQLRWYSIEHGTNMAQVIRRGIILSMQEDFDKEVVKKNFGKKTENPKVSTLTKERGELNGENYV